MLLPDEHIKRLMVTLKNHDTRSAGFENVLRLAIASLPDTPEKPETRVASPELAGALRGLAKEYEAAPGGFGHPAAYKLQQVLKLFGIHERD